MASRKGMVEKRCFNCVHWEVPSTPAEKMAYYDGGKAECLYAQKTGALMSPGEGNSPWRSHLYTAPNFCCQAFEPRVRPD